MHQKLLTYKIDIMNPKVEKFEDLIVWQNAIELCACIYKTFKNSRDFAFRDQICRAAVSVPSNIAEGFERQHNKEYVQFLFIAKGSAGEVRTQVEIASKLEYIDEMIYNSLIDDTRKISAQLFKLIQTRKEKFS